MKIEELENIFDLLIQEDLEGLVLYCKDLNLITDTNIDIQNLYKLIANTIENNEDLMIYYKEYAKVNEEIRVLIPYFHKLENVQFFAENFEIFSIKDQISNQFEENIKNIQYSKKEEIEERDRKVIKHIKRYGLIYLVILEIFVFILTIDALRPYVMTHIFKTHTITDATIIDEQRNISFTNYFTSDLNILYSYDVVGINYTNDEHTLLVGINLANTNKQQNTIKVYYNNKEPSKSKIYNKYSKFLKILLLLSNFLLLIGISRFSKLRKEGN